MNSDSLAGEPASLPKKHLASSQQPTAQHTFCSLNMSRAPYKSTGSYMYSRQPTFPTPRQHKTPTPHENPCLGQTTNKVMHTSVPSPKHNSVLSDFKQTPTSNTTRQQRNDLNCCCHKLGYQQAPVCFTKHPLSPLCISTDTSAVLLALLRLARTARAAAARSGCSRADPQQLVVQHAGSSTAAAAAGARLPSKFHHHAAAGPGRCLPHCCAVQALRTRPRHSSCRPLHAAGSSSRQPAVAATHSSRLWCRACVVNNNSRISIWC